MTEMTSPNGQGASDVKLRRPKGNDSLIGGAGLDTLIGKKRRRPAQRLGRQRLPRGSLRQRQRPFGGGGHDLLYGDRSNPNITSDGNDIVPRPGRQRHDLRRRRCRPARGRIGRRA
ncbi:MAG: hypothetical protein CM1200mP2_41090 [Planctomycetaceae bacterium]|nr:MAG: hypothetical protein CM1200mP2_41090 [Planctomycetaceae bacterium]